MLKIMGTVSSAVVPNDIMLCKGPEQMPWAFLTPESASTDGWRKVCTDGMCKE